MKTVAEIQLKICRFSLEPKAIWKFGDSSINHKLARGKYTVRPGEFDWLLQVILIDR